MSDPQAEREEALLEKKAKKKFTMTCRGVTCGAELVWLGTAKGKKMPVNVESLSDEDCELLARGEPVLFRRDEHVSHFSTCPDAAHFSSKKKEA